MEGVDYYWIMIASNLLGEQLTWQSCSQLYSKMVTPLITHLRIPWFIVRHTRMFNRWRRVTDPTTPAKLAGSQGIRVPCNTLCMKWAKEVIPLKTVNWHIKRVDWSNNSRGVSLSLKMMKRKEIQGRILDNSFKVSHQVKNSLGDHNLKSNQVTMTTFVSNWENSVYNRKVRKPTPTMNLMRKLVFLKILYIQLP